MLIRVRLFCPSDSFIDKISVYSARVNMGTKLGEKIAREWEDLDIDVVIPIPETSCDISAGNRPHSRQTLSSGLCEEPLRRPDVYHARSAAAS